MIMKSNFWIENASEYSQEEFDINSSGTHPAIIKIIQQRKAGKRILDFGCGDGSLIFNLGRNYEYSIYDTSPSMLELAESKLEGFNLTIHEEISDIPNRYFDVIILSMVLVCVYQENEFNSILNTIKQSLTNNGICIIANPHPCFRNIPFSSYFTEFSIGKKFNYFKNSQPHRLYIRESKINFVDYHWTISYLVNAIVKNGLELIEMIELRDNQGSEYSNKHFSPSIIYVCK